MFPASRPAFPPLPLMQRPKVRTPVDTAGLARGTPDAPSPATALGGGVVRSGRERPLVLVVDDEADLVELISLNLERNGYEVLAAGDGERALELARRHTLDLILLDLMLPGLDGTEVARRLRADAATGNVPIVMLTARAEETEQVVGLMLGADDYVCKPFSPKVLMARIQAVLRRQNRSSAPAAPESPAAGRLTVGPLAMDTEKHETLCDGEPVRLTLTEFKLLRALVEAGGRVLSRDRLMDQAMGTDVFVTDRAIDVHVTAIRRKLGRYSWLVHTVRGVGYRLQDRRPEDQQ